MAIVIEKEIQCVELVHRRADRFYLVFDLLDVDDVPIDSTGLVLKWDIYDDTGAVIISMTGEILEDQAIFDEPAASFSALPFIADRTHRLYDDATDTTFSEGKFTLK